MINAIYSNLISLLWAQAESIVPTLWLCTWLCWFFFFFILPLFICLYHGLQDFQRGWHGVGLQTTLASNALKCGQLGDEFRAGLKSVPNSASSVSRRPTFLHKGCKMCCSFNIFFNFLLSIMPPNHKDFLSTHRHSAVKWIKKRVKKRWGVIR